MKQIVAVFILVCMLAGGIRCVYVMESRQLHKEELEIAMEMSMRHSLTAAAVKKNYCIADEQELYADFIGELFLMLGTDGEYHVKVYEISLEKGIMDIEVAVGFRLPGGGTDQVSCRKCAVVTEL